jgi:hypothetical protein
MADEGLGGIARVQGTWRPQWITPRSDSINSSSRASYIPIRIKEDRN